MNNEIAVARPQLSTEMSCVDCKFSYMGYCHWKVPPAVARLYAMLQQEPLTKINYEGVFEEQPECLPVGVCSAFTQRPVN